MAVTASSLKHLSLSFKFEGARGFNASGMTVFRGQSITACACTKLRNFEAPISLQQIPKLSKICFFIPWEHRFHIFKKLGVKLNDLFL